MFIQRIFAALGALLISATVVDTAQAYPTTARSGTTTVTGTYRPLELKLNLVPTYQVPGEEGPRESTLEYGSYFDEGGECGQVCSFSIYESVVRYVNLSAIFTGTYTTMGESIPTGGSAVTGNAGYWQYRLNVEDGFSGITISDNGSSTVIDVFANDSGLEFGTLTYLGGGSFAGVPASDTPLTGADKLALNSESTSGNDWFQYFTTVADLAMRITSSDSEGTDFSLSFQQDIQHLGPFGSPLDPTRTNLACFTGGQPSTQLDSNGNPINAIPCGNVTLTASALDIPEPASLALVGLALTVLAVGRRRQRLTPS